MKKFKRKPKVLTPEQAEEIRVQEFFDRISPSTVKFFTDHYICGNSYKSVGGKGISAVNGRTGNTVTSCRQKRSNTENIQQTCRQLGTKADNTACSKEK